MAKINDSLINDSLRIGLDFTPSVIYGFRMGIAKLLIRLACWIATADIGNITISSDS